MYEERMIAAERVGGELVELFIKYFESGDHPGSIMAGMLIAIAVIAHEHGTNAEVARILRDIADSLDRKIN